MTFNPGFKPTKDRLLSNSPVITIYRNVSRLLLNDMSVYQPGVFERAPWNSLFYRVFVQNLVFVL